MPKKNKQKINEKINGKDYEDAIPDIENLLAATTDFRDQNPLVLKWCLELAKNRLGLKTEDVEATIEEAEIVIKQVQHQKVDSELSQAFLDIHVKENQQSKRKRAEEILAEQTSSKQPNPSGFFSSPNFIPIASSSNASEPAKPESSIAPSSSVS
ncbi:MAG: hypothetical protein WBE18_08635 [Gammaproteobacteria bacterium]